MKLIVVLISVSLMFVACKNNSDDSEQKTKSEKLLKTEKIGFYTQKMNLSEVEAQKFWPLYNKIEHQRDSIWRTRHKLMRLYYHNMDKMTIVQNNEMLKKVIELDSVGFDAQQKNIEALRKILPAKKVLLLFYTEIQFKHYMIENMRGRRMRGMRQNRFEKRHFDNDVANTNCTILIP